MYPPQAPSDGIYRVKILSVDQDDIAYTIRYDISVGPSVGWATYMYQQTGKWPLIWRISKQYGSAVIWCALNALNQSPHTSIHSLIEAEGRHICLDLHRQRDGKYIDVKRSFPLSAYAIDPDDIRIGVEGGWRYGEANWRHALLLANLSGLPILKADSHESQSPMVDWCAKHNIIILPECMRPGDYTTLGSEIIVDRKENILELYKDFASSANRNSYENDAIHAQTDEKQLIYVTGTSHDDHVKQITDLTHWHITIKGQTFSGAQFVNRLLCHKTIYPNVSFIFVKDQNMCQTIWNLISKCNP